ncbi:MAG: signal recognition particle protein, partial [Candidatus Marinimicrobia bacterium]|nr:signal recognition particle protein [Candidatus Neomarinimicrobiota bacterium]
RAEGTKVIKSIKPGEQFIKIIHDELVSLLGGKVSPLVSGRRKPKIILLAGLQGSGKTTTAVKIAMHLKKKGFTSLLAAADVYRPAAIDQLMTLGQQVDIPVFSKGKSDPVVICQEAVDKADSLGLDYVILDTAGRLHVDGEMMEEIQSIHDDINPHETLFVVDGMTGQDAVNSAKIFSETISITGTVLTKMEGDSRGGAAVSVTEVTGVPIKFLGVSEKIDGLEVFDPKRIADRILGFGDVVSLVEKAQESIENKDEKAFQKIFSGKEFNLNDFISQIRQIKKMGSLKQIVGMLPGVNRKMMKKINMNDKQLVWTEAIIQSMTVQERNQPKIINGSRRKRIANGSGRSVQEVNKLLKEFFQIKKMMKQMSKKSFPQMRKSGSHFMTVH